MVKRDRKGDIQRDLQDSRKCAKPLWGRRKEESERIPEEQGEKINRNSPCKGRKRGQSSAEILMSCMYWYTVAETTTT